MGRQVGDSFSGLSILPALDYYLFKWPLFAYICSFQQKITDKFQTSAGFQLGSLEHRVSTLTT